MFITRGKCISRFCDTNAFLNRMYCNKCVRGKKKYTIMKTNII